MEDKSGCTLSEPSQIEKSPLDGPSAMLHDFGLVHTRNSVLLYPPIQIPGQGSCSSPDLTTYQLPLPKAQHCVVTKENDITTKQKIFKHNYANPNGEHLEFRNDGLIVFKHLQ